MSFRLNFIFSFLLLFAVSLTAQTVTVPFEMQTDVIIKSLKYMYGFKYKAKDTLTIGIIYQSNNQLSKDIKNQFRNYKAKSTYPILQFQEVDMSKAAYQNSSVFTHSDILYVTPLRGVDVRALIQFCNQKNILTYSGVTHYGELGVVMSFDLLNQHLEIIINKGSLDNLSYSMSSRILRLARIID